MIKILVADDHALVREGLKKIINEQKDMTVSGEAADGQQVLEKITGGEFDLILLDLSMPKKSGLDILPTLRLQCPETPVLVLSMYPEEHYAMRVLKAGAAGYLTKDKVPDELINAIRKVSKGGKYVSASLAEKLLFELPKNREKAPHETLSEREFQVLRLIAAGKSTKEIADTLFLSVKTVGTYRTRIMEKMNMQNTGELINYAVTNHLV